VANFLRVVGLCVAAILIIAVMVGTFFGALYLKRYVYSLEREAVKESLPYKEGKTAQMMQLASEYNRLEIEIAKTDSEKLIEALKSQQVCIIEKLKIEREKMHGKDIPSEVQKIINYHE